MPMKYRFDVLEALKAKGYTTYRIRQEMLLSESTVQKLRRNEPVSWDNVATLCKLLDVQPGELLEYVK